MKGRTGPKRHARPRAEARPSSAAPSATTLGATLARVPDWAVLAVFCVVFSTLTLASVARKSATYDETTNLLGGYLELTQGNYWLAPATSPLVKALAASPLLFMRVTTPVVDLNQAWRTIDRFFFEANDGDALLRVARAAVLPLSLVLGALVFLWTRRVFGRGAALFALLLYGFEPNIIAHSALITTDLGVACFLFLTVYGLFRLTEGVSPGRLLVTALGLSLALVTKLSMVSLIAIVALLGIVASLSRIAIPVRIGGRPRWTLASRRQKLVGLGVVLLAAGLLAWGVIWAAYRFAYNGAESAGLRVDPARFTEPGTVLWYALGALRRTRALPEPYFLNFFHHVHVSMPAYLLGEVRPGGWWYYFACTLFFKTPLALLIMIGAALALLGKLRPKVVLARTFLVIPAAAYFVFISASGINVGHRHMLAVLPFLMVLAGGLIPWAARRPTWVRGGLIALSLWYVVSSLATFPHYLAYFNELTGGPDSGYKYLGDSNLDWGQDLEGLKRYMDQHGISRVWLSYFGAASPEYYGITYDRLPGSKGSELTAVPREVALGRLGPLSGTVAISVTNLQGIYLPLIGVNRNYYAAYRDMTPVARIGHSIFVYRFE